MSDAKLQIDITANTDAAVANIKGLNTALANTEKAAAVGAKGMQTFNKATGTSTQALTNLNRVVQDAPFGLIGVANNIDPLIGSFQKLKAETGSTGGALKALVGSLSGPAGVAFGISAVTSLLIAFGPQIMDFINGTNKAAKAQDEFAQELEKAEQNALKTGLQLQGLIAIASDQNQSDKVRNNAIIELNETTKKYGITIDKLSIANGTAAIEVNKLTNALIAQAVAEKLADKAAELRIRQIEATKNYTSAQNELTQAKIADAAATKRQIVGQSAYASGNVADADRLARAQNKATSATADYRNVTQELQETINLMVTEQQKGVVITESSAAADEKAAKSAKKLAKAKKEVADAVKSIEQIEFERSLKFQQYSQEDADAEEKRIGKIITAEQALQKVRDEAEKKRIEEQNKRREDAARALEFGAQVPADIAKNVGIPAPVSQSAADAAKAQADAIKQVAQATNDAQAAFSLLSPTIDAAFNSLANGTNIADAVGQAIKQLIINLIKAVAQAALLSLIFSLLPGGQAAAAAKGGFGGILKNLLGFGGRAIGGPVSGGQGYIVGENGPELFVPGTPGSIVPNMALAGSGGGNVSFEIRGDVLYGLLRRTANNKMANFG